MSAADTRARSAMVDRLAFCAWSEWTTGKATAANWLAMPACDRARWRDVVRVVFTRFAEFEVTP